MASFSDIKWERMNSLQFRPVRIFLPADMVSSGDDDDGGDGDHHRQIIIIMYDEHDMSITP